MSDGTYPPSRHYDAYPLSRCVDDGRGTIYEVRSRNLWAAVFDGANGFIGIREKFGGRFLDTEYHWDVGPPLGTVRPTRVLGHVPEDVPVACRLDGTVCELCGEPVDFNPNRDPGERWRHVAVADESAVDHLALATIVSNGALFELLKKIELELDITRRDGWLA